MSQKIATRSSRMAVVKEVTQGSPVFPSAGGDYCVLQNGFSLVPDFSTLKNDELTGSIGEAAETIGIEKVSFKYDHYLTHSGTQGTAPEYDVFLESFFGSQSANGTERTTGAASTTSLVKLAAGGTDFARGKAVLVKNGAGGANYEIRNVLSVATNDLTLAQNLLNAPGSGVSCGKCVHFAPQDSGHPSYSAHLYRGNGGSLELGAGLKTSEFSIDFVANQFIKASFAAQGTKFYFDPIEITSSNCKIDFETDAGVAVATLSQKAYRDPKELAEEVALRMDAAAGVAETITCSYSNSTGKFTIVASGTVLFTIKWNTGANTANTAAAKLGFSSAADSSAALTYTSANAASWASPQSPSFDAQVPLVAKNMEVLLGDSTDTTVISAQSIQIKGSNSIQDIEDLCAESGIDSSVVTGRTIEATIKTYLAQHDVDKFYRFRNGSDVMLTINAGSKSSGNWIAGKCVNAFIPQAKITKFEVTDLNGTVMIDLGIKAYVPSGNAEFYLNFL